MFWPAAREEQKLTQSRSMDLWTATGKKCLNNGHIGSCFPIVGSLLFIFSFSQYFYIIERKKKQHMQHIHNFHGVLLISQHIGGKSFVDFSTNRIREPGHIDHIFFPLMHWSEVIFCCCLYDIYHSISHSTHCDAAQHITCIQITKNIFHLNLSTNWSTNQFNLFSLSLSLARLLLLIYLINSNYFVQLIKQLQKCL